MRYLVPFANYRAGLVLIAVGFTAFAYAEPSAFAVDMAIYIMLTATAAGTLHLMLGLGGLVSFGHAAYLGIGAYSVGILTHYDITNGWAHLAAALGASGVFAGVTGALSLRTRGIHFIMITLAFAQMLFYAMMSISAYGGDDGLAIVMPATLPLPFGDALDTTLDMGATETIYWASLALLMLVLWAYRALSAAPFGRMLHAIRDNEARTAALGVAPFWHLWAVYVVSAMLCALVGALFAHFNAFVSPDMMDWHRSGSLIFMVVLGGVGAWFGPLLGAVVFIGVEEWLSSHTVYWPFFLGAFLIAVMMVAPGGMASIADTLKRTVGKLPITTRTPRNDNDAP